MTESVGRLGRWLALATVGVLLGACASSSVVLLPEQDGRPTAVTVRQGDETVVLDKPYAAAKATRLGPRAYQSSAEDVQAQFADALAAQPARPTSFTLYFVEGTDEFTAESKVVVERILSEIARRPVPDVLVVGHTDAVGSDPFNDALGQQRADAVRAILIRLGIPPDDVRAISRGKRAPAVPTPDGIAEPRNRRVEILVR